MNDLIFTTEGSNKGIKAAEIVSAIVSLVVGFFSGCMFFVMREMTKSGGVFILLVIAIVAMIFGFIELGRTTSHSRTYVRVYSDRLEGVGIQGSSVASFNVTYSQVNSISSEKDFLHIYTNVGSYKIITKSNLANEIVNYYNTSIRSN